MSNPLDLTNLRVEKRTTRFAPVVGRPTSARTPAVRERTPAPLSSIGPSGAGLLSQEAGPVPNNDRLEASLPRLRANADLEAGDHLEGQTVEGHDIDLAREVATASDNAVSFGQSIVANPTLEDNEDVIGAADRAGIAEADEEAVGVTNPATDSGMLRPSESRKRARKTRIRVAPVLTEESDRLSLEADGQEGQQAELPPNPTDVISNLTLTELIDNFEGSLPSKSHLGRSKARSEKQKLRRLRARRDELLSLGISLPSHLQGLPPESGSSDDDEEGTRPPDKRHSSFDRALDRTAGPVAPQLRIVDGQIQIDESSLFVDLHHNAERENGFRGEVEGNSKRHVTSFTYMRRKNHADKWSQQETDVFFECLSYWGTDFTLIGKCFPRRPHKQIKLKFQKEEKLNPGKVFESVRKRARCDPTRFAELTGVNLEDLEGFAVGDQPAFASSTFEEDHDVEDQLPETVNEVAQSRRRRNHR